MAIRLPAGYLEKFEDQGEVDRQPRAVMTDLLANPEAGAAALLTVELVLPHRHLVEWLVDDHERRVLTPGPVISQHTDQIE